MIVDHGYWLMMDDGWQCTTPLPLSLWACLDGDLLVGSEVFHQQIHEPHLIREAHDEVEATGVEGDREGFLAQPRPGLALGTAVPKRMSDPMSSK